MSKMNGKEKKKTPTNHETEKIATKMRQRQVHFEVVYWHVWVGSAEWSTQKGYRLDDDCNIW